mmetsp:Transcript_32707/g.128527  ORF Transcript_32707/g.128527 Transcript_32707/m.128527 type:complete len:108 (+) Transcript_32707:483-806(+)
MQGAVATLPDNIKTAVRNSGGGHYNHCMFWTVMGGVGTANAAPFGDLKEKIDSTFGALDEMKKLVSRHKSFHSRLSLSDELRSLCTVQHRGGYSIRVRMGLVVRCRR